MKRNKKKKQENNIRTKPPNASIIYIQYACILYTK